MTSAEIRLKMRQRKRLVSLACSNLILRYSQLGNQLKVVSLWSNDTWQSKLLRSAWVMPTAIPLLCRKTHITSSPSSSFCWNRKKPTSTSLHITFGKKRWHSGRTDHAASRTSWRVTITQDTQSISTLAQDTKRFRDSNKSHSRSDLPFS